MSSAHPAPGSQAHGSQAAGFFPAAPPHGWVAPPSPSPERVRGQLSGMALAGGPGEASSNRFGTGGVGWYWPLLLSLHDSQEHFSAKTSGHPASLRPVLNLRQHMSFCAGARPGSPLKSGNPYASTSAVG